MKRDFNKFTKNDLPVDANGDLPIEKYEEPKKNENEKNLKKRENKLKRENSQSANQKNAPNTTKKSGLKTHLKSDNIDIVELEDLNEQNIRNFRHRTRRNRVIIITLVVLLLITAIAIGIYAGLTNIENNCFLYVHGNVDAVYIVDGDELDRFRSPNTVQGNRVYTADYDLRIEDSGSYNIRFTIEVYQSNQLLDNILIYEPNRTLFYDGGDGYYYSRNPIDVSGGQTIDLCLGVILDKQYEDTLNINNFRLEFHTYIDRV